VSGLAWANVDSSCKLNYYVRLSSSDKRGESKISLKDYPMKNLKAMALVPIRTLELQEFYGNEVSGYQVKKIEPVEKNNYYPLLLLLLTRWKLIDSSSLLRVKFDVLI
jgi:hypothetical protein